MKKLILAAAAANLLMGACVSAGEQDFTRASMGNYELDKAHASLVWKVSHMGLSDYTARFTEFDASLDFNPDDPAASSVTATINPMSVETDHPTKAKDWNNELATDAKWFNATEFPQIIFKSTGITPTGEFTGAMTGELTFLGVTRPVTLEVTFNGTGNAPWYGTRDLVGFSATGQLKRSDFGMTTMSAIVGDDVDIIIEAEFVETE